MNTENERPLAENLQSSDLSTANSITNITQGSMFWHPVYLASSEWLEHVPFAFWLIEAHKPSTVVEVGTNDGVSYFAMCQAIDRLRLDASSFAIGEWEKDTESNGYGPSDYESVLTHNQSHYSGFSRLVRSTNEQALEHFSNGCVDLLHIDGIKNYSEAKRILEVWKPKLSPTAVVMLHATNVREGNVQLHRLLEETKRSYLNFEFKHGQGLGVLGVGSEQTSLMRSFFESASKPSGAQIIQDVFSRLGRACADRYNAEASVKKAALLTIEISTQKLKLDALSESLANSKQTLDKKAKELEKLRQGRNQQIEVHALERGQLVERSSMLQKLQDELKSELAGWQSRLDKFNIQMENKNQELLRLSIKNSNHDNKLNLLKENSEEVRSQLTITRSDNEKLTRELKKAVAIQQSCETDKHTYLSAIQELEQGQISFTQSLSQKEDENNRISQQLASLRENVTAISDKYRVAEREQSALHNKLRESELRLKNATLVISRKDADIEFLKESAALGKPDSEFDKSRELQNKPTGVGKELQTSSENGSGGDETSKTVKKPMIPSTNQHGKPSWFRRTKKNVNLIKSSGLFNKNWYLQTHPEINSHKSYSKNPARHYLEFGGFEGRNPSELFESKWYLDQNPDVAREGLNPLLHFILYGRAEGRPPKPFPNDGIS